MIWLLISMLLFFKSCSPEAVEDESQVLCYDCPATCIEEAFPLDNGRLGVKVYGDPLHELIALYDVTLGTTAPEDTSGNNVKSWLKLGVLRMEYEPAEITDYSRKLNLTTATTTISFKHDDNPVRINYFVSAPDSAFVINIQSEKPLSLTLRLESDLPHESIVTPKELILDGEARLPETINLSETTALPNTSDSLSSDMKFRLYIAASADERVIPDLQGGLELDRIRYATLCLAHGTTVSAPGRDPYDGRPAYKKAAGKQMMKAFQKGFKACHADHVKYLKAQSQDQPQTGRTR